MIARLRKRLNDLEQRNPLGYAVTVVLSCDAVICVALFTAKGIAA